MSNAKATISIRFADMLFLAALQIRDKDPVQSGVNRQVNLRLQPRSAQLTNAFAEEDAAVSCYASHLY